jgi:hypothetical protein
MKVSLMLKFFVFAFALFIFSTCSYGSTPDGQIFTLYRNSMTNENMRIHVATFDASENEDYNHGNCEQAQLLFQNQPSVKIKFWCEKGRFKK